VAQLAYDEKENIDLVLDRAEQALFSVSERRLTRDVQPIKEVVGRFYDRIQELSETGTKHCSASRPAFSLTRPTYWVGCSAPI
jgi:replicative DNA helicase